jgi:Ca-activated chloride channel family protein
MRFAYDLLVMPYLAIAIACALLVGGFAAALILSSVRRGRATKAFGDPSLVTRLETFDASGRRALKGVLLVSALVFAFLALGRPQWGRGTKLVPATNLDVVIVLDYSKSMYARDVAPSRIARAKAEIAKLVRELPGARFGAVAFAGEPMSFPLTSDSAAIAQFFRQLEPNDMPIGGTAIARALERAREVFARDPKSKDHVRVIVLVTDGEDLEGDPVQVAKEAAEEKTRIDVVQIGGLMPEPVPDVGPDGKVIGTRKDDDGSTLMTSLTTEGEKQLSDIATTTGGAIVKAQKGETGIDDVARGLKKMMREELAERVEVAFDEEYMWPLGICILLLLIEGCIPEAPLPKLGFGFVGGTAALRDAPGATTKKTKKKTKRKKEAA